MKTAMKTLAVSAAEGSEAFNKLGISQEQLANMNQAETFEATVKALQNVTDEQERMTLASQLLGKGAVELGGIFNMTNEELDASKQKMYELGAYMDSDAIAASDNYQDTMLDLQDSLKGVKISMMTDFLPGVTSVMDGLSKVFSGNGGVEEIQSGLEQIIANITALAPTFFTLASTLVNSLLSGFAPMLPQLVSSIFGFIQTGLITITSMLPQLLPVIQSGIQGIMSAVFTCLPIITQSLLTLITDLVTWLASGDNVTTFVNSIVELTSLIVEQISLVLPVLLPAIIQIIGDVVNCLLEPSNVEMLIGAVLQLAGAIFVALVDCVPVLIDFIIDLFGNIGALLVGFIDKGSDIVASGIGAIVDWCKNVGNKIKSGVQTLWTNIKTFFSNGINNAKQTVTNGLTAISSKFTSIFDKVKNTVKNAIEKVKNFMNFEWSLPDLKLPHLKVTGSLDLLAVPPQIPSVSVEWYGKAMSQPYMFNDATIFGSANGKLLGAGERGSELLIGTNKLMEMMQEAVGSDRNVVINVYGAEGQDVNALAEVIAVKLENLTRRKGAVYA